MQKKLLILLLIAIPFAIAIVLKPINGTPRSLGAAMQANKLLGRASEETAANNTIHTAKKLASLGVLSLDLGKSGGFEIVALIVDRGAFGQNVDVSADRYAGVIIDCSDGKSDAGVYDNHRYIVKVISQKMGRNIPVLKKTDISSNTFKPVFFTWREITGLIEIDFTP